MTRLFNNPEFSDATICVTDDNQNDILELKISKLFMAKKSRFFDRLFRVYQNEKIFLFPVQKCQINGMELLIKFIHTNQFPEESSDNQEFSLMIYRLALLFDVPDVFSYFTIQSTEEIETLYDFIEKQNGNIGVGSYQWKPQTWKAVEVFHQKAGEFLRSKFQNINDIVKYEREFISLPVRAIKEIMINPSFQRDRALSMTTIMMIWINYTFEIFKESDDTPLKREREIDQLKELFSLIDLSLIYPNFLSTISQIIKDIKSEDVQKFLTERCQNALHQKKENGGSER